MAGNDYRKHKALLHCAVDSGVYVALKCLAADQGRSVTDVVNGLLKSEVERHGYVGVGSGDRALPPEEGSIVGAHGGGSGGSGVVGGSSGRGVDWDAILGAGARAKMNVLKSSVPRGGSVSVPRVDPLEEIA